MSLCEPTCSLCIGHVALSLSGSGSGSGLRLGLGLGLEVELGLGLVLGLVLGLWCSFSGSASRFLSPCRNSFAPLTRS